MTTPRALRAPRIIVMAAIVAALLATACSPSVPAISVVEVDLYSGGENPVVEIDPATVSEVFDVIHAGEATPTSGPETGLGFRGLIVFGTTEAWAGEPWTELRLLPDAIYLSGEAGTFVISDGAEDAFDTVWRVVRRSLGAHEVAAVERDF